jgi:hypothetical protein
MELQKGWLASKANYLTAICDPTVYRMWKSRHQTTLSVSMTCHRDNFFFSVVAVGHGGGSNNFIL